MRKNGFKSLLALTVCAVSAFGLFACKDDDGGKTDPPPQAPTLEFSYELNEDDTYDICGATYSGDDYSFDSFEIPAQYNGKDVTSISELFGHGFGVCELTIPNTITSIQEDVFKNLSYNTLSSKATTAEDGNYIFKLYYDGTLEDWTKIVFENANSNPMSAIEVNFDAPNNHFYYKDSSGAMTELKKLEIGVEEIGAYQFAAFNQVDEIKLTGTKKVGDSAFSSCLGVKKLSLGVVEEIEYAGFHYLTSLEDVDLGTALVEIKEREPFPFRLLTCPPSFFLKR